MEGGDKYLSTMVTIRELDPNKDTAAVEELERRCEAGSSSGGKMALFTDLLGDPICRIRHSPSFLMLVTTLSLSHEHTQTLL